MIVLPILLIVLATAAAGVVAYGTHPDWVVHKHGMAIITTSHHLQWPLTFLALVLCLVLVGYVAVGRRRIFWLLGLAPVAALLFHHFRSDPVQSFAILDNPPCVPAARAGPLVNDEDYVVGLRLGDTPYAYPYALLYCYPAVLQVERGKRLLLMWSPFANRACASVVDRDVRAEELAIVSMPANALLLYNSRLGQFINGVTGMTLEGKPVTGFVSPVTTTKTTWREWKALHPDTRVLAVAPRYTTGLPRRPVLPYFKTPAPADAPPDMRVALVTPAPSASVAVPAADVADRPLNVTADAGPPVILFRDPKTGLAKAFDRHIDAETIADLRTLEDPKRPAVAFVDAATNTGFSLAGQVVDGNAKFKGAKLNPVPVDEDLPYSVMKFWYPTLALMHVKPEDYVAAYEPPSPQPARPVRVRHRPRRR